MVWLESKDIPPKTYDPHVVHAFATHAFETLARSEEVFFSLLTGAFLRPLEKRVREGLLTPEQAVARLKTTLDAYVARLEQVTFPLFHAAPIPPPSLPLGTGTEYVSYAEGMHALFTLAYPNIAEGDVRVRIPRLSTLFGKHDAYASYEPLAQDFDSARNALPFINAFHTETPLNVFQMTAERVLKARSREERKDLLSEASRDVSARARMKKDLLMKGVEYALGLHSTPAEALPLFERSVEERDAWLENIQRDAYTLSEGHGLVIVLARNALNPA